MSLKIIGAGHLGARVAVFWHQIYPEATIYLRRRSENKEREGTWEEYGFKKDDGTKADHVVFCVPAPRSQGKETEYIEEVRNALLNDWSRVGAFIFTGSSGIYRENNGGIVNEHCAISGYLDNATTAALLSSEKAAVEGGGTTIRLGGMYTRSRGPHNYWLSRDQTQLPSSPNGLINLLHYDDAARAIILALEKPTPGVFVLSDGVPITRENINAAAVACPDYEKCTIPKFVGSPNVEGKTLDSTKFRETFNWTPEFKSFAVFMKNEYHKEMNVDHLL